MSPAALRLICASQLLGQVPVCAWQRVPGSALCCPALENSSGWILSHLLNRASPWSVQAKGLDLAGAGSQGAL